MLDSRVHPELQAALKLMPAMDITIENLAAVRAEIHGVEMPQLPIGDYTVTDRMVPGPQGAPEVRVHLYTPGKKGEGLPGILYIHGGGYILGKPEDCDPVCIRMLLEIGCVIASVDYRLAPEAPFPAPLEDCYAGLKWFSENALDLGINNTKIAVVGGSAGGGLAAALALLARDRNGPAIAFQAPLYPMIDDRNITPSSYEITDKRLWSRDKNIFGWEMYLGEMYGRDVPYYAAPTRAADFQGLPPAYTFIGELDLFRDETTDYVARLLRAGVPTEFHIYPGCFHGFDVSHTGIGRLAETELIEVLKRALIK